MILIPANQVPPLFLATPICCAERMSLVDCNSPACPGVRCVDCGEGCDIDTRPESGVCATAIEEAA